MRASPIDLATEERRHAEPTERLLGHDGAETQVSDTPRRSIRLHGLCGCASESGGNRLAFGVKSASIDLRRGATGLIQIERDTSLQLYRTTSKYQVRCPWYCSRRPLPTQRLDSRSRHHCGVRVGLLGKALSPRVVLHRACDSRSLDGGSPKHRHRIRNRSGVARIQQSCGKGKGCGSGRRLGCRRWRCYDRPACLWASVVGVGLGGGEQS